MLLLIPAVHALRNAFSITQFVGQFDSWHDNYLQDKFFASLSMFKVEFLPALFADGPACIYICLLKYYIH